MKTTYKKGNTPSVITIPFEVTGVDAKGHSYDKDSCIKLVEELQECGCFDKLSVNITMPRWCVEGDGAKGFINVGRINEYYKDGMFKVFVFGEEALAYIDKIKAATIIPRVRVDRDTKKVITILKFDLLMSQC